MDPDFDPFGQAFLEEFWVSMASRASWLVVGVIGVLVLYVVGTKLFQRSTRSSETTRVYDLSAPDLPEIPQMDGLLANTDLSLGDVRDLPEPTILAAAPPKDQQFYQTVLSFAQKKQQDGGAFLPDERFALGELFLADKLMGEAGLAHFDSFTRGLPYKGFELRQAMERIGAPDIGNLLERGVAIYLHRSQLTQDMLKTGMPAEQAQMHPDLPTYTELEILLVSAGGQRGLRAAADIYFRDHYPWSDV